MNKKDEKRNQTVMKKKTVETSIVVHGIAERDGKILLVQEKNRTWYLPTGSVEEGESIIDAIKREVKEETGAECEPIAIFKIIHHNVSGAYFDTTEETILRIHYFFYVELIGEQHNTENDHALGSGWFTLSEMKNLKVRTSLKHIFGYIETYFEAKQNNSMLSVKQIFV